MTTKKKTAATTKAVKTKWASRARTSTSGRKKATSFESYTRLQTLSAAINEQYNTAAIRYQELASRGLSPQLEKRYYGFANERGTELFNTWLQMAVNFCEATQKMSQQYIQELFDEMESCFPTAQAAPSSTERRVLTLDGELGTTLTGSFVIENDYPTAVTPRLLGTSLVRADGGVLDGAILLFEPSNFELAPNEKQSVKVWIPLDAERFKKGEKYTGAIAVLDLGGPDRVVTVEIGVN